MKLEAIAKALASELRSFAVAFILILNKYGLFVHYKRLNLFITVVQHKKNQICWFVAIDAVL
jgi:hypothetical protein